MRYEDPRCGRAATTALEPLGPCLRMSGPKNVGLSRLVLNFRRTKTIVTDDGSYATT